MYTDLITGNIAFLIKYKVGPNIQANQVSLPIVDVRDANNCPISHKVAVCVHIGPEKLQVVVEGQIEWGRNVIICLTEMVDILIKKVVEEVKKGSEEEARRVMTLEGW
jgi:hypothetical protein